MAKDDYDVIVYKVLLYYYACKKRKIVYDQVSFKKAYGAEIINEEYFADVLRMMQDEGLIEGLTFHKPWQATWIIVSDPGDAEITSRGIAYLTENSKMKTVRDALLSTMDFVANLIGIVGLK